MNKGVLTILMVLLSVCSVLGQEHTDKFLLDTNVFKEVIETKKVQLIDVRTPKEFELGTIEYAQNIDFLDDTFKENITVLNKKEPVYIFCKSGKRSAAAKKVMVEQGFENVYELEGGFVTWENK